MFYKSFIIFRKLANIFTVNLLGEYLKYLSFDSKLLVSGKIIQLFSYLIDFSHRIHSQDLKNALKY